jgi:hypothetical protein
MPEHRSGEFGIISTGKSGLFLTAAVLDRVMRPAGGEAKRSVAFAAHRPNRSSLTGVSNMTRQWTTWLSLALCGGIATGFGTAPARAQQTCAALTITGHPSYPPVAWAAGDTIVGAAPELVRGIASKLGVKTVTSKNFGTWEGAQNAARDGQADVIFRHLQK